MKAYAADLRLLALGVRRTGLCAFLEGVWSSKTTGRLPTQERERERERESEGGREGGREGERERDGDGDGDGGTSAQEPLSPNVCGSMTQASLCYIFSRPQADPCLHKPFRRGRESFEVRQALVAGLLQDSQCLGV